MKIHLTLFIFTLITINSGCEKAARLENKLEGTWELRHRNGTFLAPNTPVNYNTGNGNIYKFNGHTFELQVNGKVIDSGTFSVSKEDSNYNEKLEFILVLDGVKYDNSLPFKLSEEKLILHFGSLASDGVISTYTKL